MTACPTHFKITCQHSKHCIYFCIPDCYVSPFYGLSWDKDIKLSLCVVSQCFYEIVSCKASFYASHGSLPDLVEH